MILQLKLVIFTTVVTTITALPYNSQTTTNAPSYQQQEQYEQPKNLNDFLQRQTQQKQHLDDQEHQHDAARYQDRLLPTPMKTTTSSPLVYRELQQEAQTYNDRLVPSLPKTTSTPLPQQDLPSYADDSLPKFDDSYSDSRLNDSVNPTDASERHHQDYVENNYADQISQRISTFTTSTEAPTYQQQQQMQQNGNLADILNQNQMISDQMSQREQEMLDQYVQQQQNGTYDQQNTVSEQHTVLPYITPSPLHEQSLEQHNAYKQTTTTRHQYHQSTTAMPYYEQDHYYTDPYDKPKTTEHFYGQDIPISEPVNPLSLNPNAPTHNIVKPTQEYGEDPQNTASYFETITTPGYRNESVNQYLEEQRKTIESTQENLKYYLDQKILNVQHKLNKAVEQNQENMYEYLDAQKSNGHDAYYTNSTLTAVEPLKEINDTVEPMKDYIERTYSIGSDDTIIDTTKDILKKSNDPLKEYLDVIKIGQERVKKVVKEYMDSHQDNIKEAKDQVQQYLSGVRDAVEQVQGQVSSYTPTHREEDDEASYVAAKSTTAYKTTTSVPSSTTTTKTTTTTTPPVSTAAAATAAAVAEATATSAPRTPSLSLCNECVISHGVGYAPLAGTCAGYIQCVYVSGNATAVHVMTCPAGTQWNQDILACDFPHVVGCEENKLCTTRGVPGEAAVYQAFTRDLTWDTRTCPAGYTYNTALCTCSDRVTSSQGNTCYAGDMKAAPGESTWYLQRVHDTWVRMPCPAATAFNPATCLCDIVTSSHHVTQAPPTRPLCQPTFRLTFAEGLKDTSPNGFWIENRGVKVINGQGNFDGKSQLVVPGLSNMDLGAELTVSITYKQADTSARQTLVANGCCGVEPSVQVCAKPGSVYANVTTDGSDGHDGGTVATDGQQWQTAVVNLQNDQLSVSSGIETTQTVARGRILRRPRGLVIGAGGACGGFVGAMEEVSVYRCDPSLAY